MSTPEVSGVVIAGNPATDAERLEIALRHDNIWI